MGLVVCACFTLAQCVQFHKGNNRNLLPACCQNTDAKSPSKRPPSSLKISNPHCGSEIACIKQCGSDNSLQSPCIHVVSVHWLHQFWLNKFQSPLSHLPQGYGYLITLITSGLTKQKAASNILKCAARRSGEKLDHGSTRAAHIP